MANGMNKTHVSRAVEGLPRLLHFSLFLFFGGLLIFLFNIDHEDFISVVWWIWLFSMLYGFITLLPTIRHDSPYNSTTFYTSLVPIYQNASCNLQSSRLLQIWP